MSVTSTYRLDPGRHVIETHTDHLGQQYTQTWFAPVSWDAAQIDARVQAHGVQIAERLAEAEFEGLLQ